jgi:hypothetical protein
MTALMAAIPEERNASFGSPSTTRRREMPKSVRLMKVNRLSRTICRYVRPVATGTRFPIPLARRRSASTSLSPRSGAGSFGAVAVLILVTGSISGRGVSFSLPHLFSLFNAGEQGLRQSLGGARKPTTLTHADGTKRSREFFPCLIRSAEARSLPRFRPYRGKWNGSEALDDLPAFRCSNRDPGATRQRRSF